MACLLCVWSTFQGDPTYLAGRKQILFQITLVLSPFTLWVRGSQWSSRYPQSQRSVSAYFHCPLNLARVLGEERAMVLGADALIFSGITQLQSPSSIQMSKGTNNQSCDFVIKKTKRIQYTKNLRMMYVTSKITGKVICYLVSWWERNWLTIWRK